MPSVITFSVFISRLIVSIRNATAFCCIVRNDCISFVDSLSSVYSLAKFPCAHWLRCMRICDNSSLSRPRNWVGVETRACMFSSFERITSSSGDSASPSFLVLSCFTMMRSIRWLSSVKLRLCSAIFAVVFMCRCFSSLISFSTFAR
uniref:Putative secreted protein n=1 Tax=Anopheles darlingi TaxID=43151 RepID=A0A2M4DE49_ANODA